MNARRLERALARATSTRPERLREWSLFWSLELGVSALLLAFLLWMLLR